MRDPRRFFTDSQKAAILAAANYRCQGEHCDDPDLSSGQPYKFHHDKRHASGGLTSVFNGRVLCVPCHRALGGQSTSAKPVLPLASFKDRIASVWEIMREWQKDAFGRFVDHDDQHVFALEAAPGAGKTLFAAVATRYVMDAHPEITHVICIAPWRPIIASMRNAFGGLHLDLRDTFHYDRKAGVLQQPPMGDVTLDTYAGFCRQDTADVLRTWSERYGFKFMLILDEVHHTNVFGGKWGAFAQDIAQMATKVLVMSGTYFRSDNKAISFLNYDSGKPVVDYSIGYAECVRHRYVRQVAFRYCDPSLEFYRRSRNDFITRQLSKLSLTSTKMISKAKHEVLDPKGPHVDWMIREAWSELQRYRKKWDDAACLVVCPPGSGRGGSETRIIHAVAERVRQITLQEPDVVTSDDAASHARIQSFSTNKNPFLCAVRMVSEGVDIPRIRVVLFLSYTDSEMLFRQIVGRGIRWIKGREDDTAACVVMPKFPVMAQFADRFEGEAKQGAAKQICQRCGQCPCQCERGTGEGPFEKVCVKCGTYPCQCYAVVSSEIAEGGGLISGAGVQEKYITHAKVIVDTNKAHQHANVVQLADALQKFSEQDAVPVVLSIEQRKEIVLHRVKQLVERIASYAHGNAFTTSWRIEVHEACKVASIDEIRHTWRLEQITELEQRLRQRLREVLINGNC